MVRLAPRNQILAESWQHVITLLQKLVTRISRTLSPVITHYWDIRVYMDAALQMGRDHLHYGCWEHDNDDLGRAQDNLAKRISALLPDHVRTVLDVGGGIGGLSNQLVKDGYLPLCIVPDSTLIDAGRKRFPHVRFLKSSAERFSVQGVYDAALLIESYQYFTDKPKAVANIIRHLADYGCIIVADEFSLPSDPVIGMPKEADLIAHLQANNYFLDTRVDITTKVLPTCRVVTAESDTKNNTLAEQWKATEAIYTSGKRCYLLLRFTAESGTTQQPHPANH